MTPQSEIRPAAPPRPWTLGRIHLPSPSLGDLFGSAGRPWARLRDQHRHSNPTGGVELDHRGHRR